jgi:hypothetical protein
MATLTISHYLYLKEEERYALNDGKDIETVGVCIPVWFLKGNTSEPAQEYFCKYILKNPRTGANVKQSEEGFEVYFPSIISSEEESVNQQTKRIMQKKIGTTECLLEPQDGGFGNCEFRILQKLQLKDSLHHLVHFFEIKPIEMLIDTIS